ncbi:MAG TPA: SUMF1/EgtB/PvdO family nonheme iron enzyme [Candidatus Anammoximicrobium sp.]|nr:SUMF1/EgtB/PvdO family nonheme iron enzyme [Candidatus Anammoximicrobium sp.]
MPFSFQDCIQQLTSLELVSEDEIQAALANLPDEPEARSAEQLLRELVKQSKLTAHQARVVLEGRAKSLMLGSYVVLDELGKGGMGEVFKAQHRLMDRVVALKVVSGGLVQSPDALQRFHREVRAAAKLTHPNVVAAYDAADVEGGHFLVMEYVDGHDLSSLVKKQGPLPLGQAVDCILQAARGLEYAHQQGVVHRDIKPSNLLLDRNGTVKILDMGLARISTDAAPGQVVAHQAELTSSGVILGTIDYMAPEQAQNTRLADQRADIYSLGITFYYLLTGRPAYGGDSLISKLLAHQTHPIPVLQEVIPETPAALDDIFRKMVAKQPQDRYQTMTEVVAALETFQAPAAPATRLPPPESQDAQLSDFLRSLNAPPSVKSKSPSASKIAKPAAATAAPVAAEAPDEDKTIALDSGTHRTTPDAARPTPPHEQRRKPKHAPHRAGLPAGKRRLLIASVVATVLVVLLLAAATVVVLRRGGDQTAESSGGKSAVDKPKPDADDKLPRFSGQTPKPRVGKPSKDKSWLPPWKLPEGAPPPAVAPFDAAKAKEHQEAWAKFLKLPVEKDNSLGMKLVLLPPGDFDMGTRFEDLDVVRAEVQRSHPQSLGLLDGYLAKLSPQHPVRINQPLTMSACEVTIGQFQQFVDATGYRTTALATDIGCTLVQYLPDSVTITKQHVPWHAPRSGKADPNEPVTLVTPADALAFCDWLSAKENATYRLPTEEEWEYAYRAGTFLRFGFVERLEDAAKFAWTDEGPEAPLEKRRAFPHPVGQKQPNPFGFFDLAGNVGELCVPSTGESICGRGGVFKNPAILDIYSRRDAAGVASPSPYQGFRVVREMPEKLEEVPSDPDKAEQWAMNWLTEHGVLVTQRAADASSSDSSKDKPAQRVDSVSVGAAALLRPAEYAYLKHLRGVRSLLVSGSSFNDRAAAQLASLQTIEDLRLEGVALSPVGWRYLGQLPNVRTLTLTPPVFNDEILAAFAGWPNLEALDLTQQRITDEGLRHLAGLQHLRRLVLDRTAVTDGGLEHLRELKELIELGLAETSVTDAGLANLAGLEALESLDLAGTSVSGQGLAALKSLPRLARLNVAGAQVTDEGCAGIGQLIRLQALYLSDTDVADAGLAHLRGLRDLNELTLMRTQFTDAGLASLNDLRHLRTLTMTHTQVSGVGLAHLRDLLSLESLELMWAKVGDEALPTLAGFRRLTNLGLHGNRLRGAGLEQLAKLDALQNLRLTMTDVPAEKVEELRRRLPKCKIEHDQTPNRELNAAHVATWDGNLAFATLQREGALPETVTGREWLRGYPKEPVHVVELSGEGSIYSNSLLNEVEFLSELRYLNLRNARLTNNALGQIRGLNKLQMLILDQNRIDDEGLKQLEGLENLDVLSLRGTRVTASGVQALLDKLPRCRVEADFPAPRRGGPLTAEAYVGRPASLAGLRSWTLAWDGFRQQPTCAACNPQEDLLAAAGDGVGASDRGWCGPVIRVWAMNDEPRAGFVGEAGNRQKVLFGHDRRIQALAWSPNGRYLASTGDDKTVRFWNVLEGRCLRAFVLPTPGNALAWSPSGDRLVIACDSSLELLAISQGTFRHIAVEGVRGVDWDHDGTRFLAVVGNKIQVYDAATLKADRAITTGELPLGTAAWSPDGKQIAAAYDGRLVRIWDVESCELARQIEGKAGEIAAVAWSPQGDRLATAGSVLSVWKAAGGERMSVAGLTSGAVQPPSWTRTGTQLAVCSPASVDLYDAAKGTLQRSYGKLAPLGRATAALSPDGRRLLTVQGQTGVVRDPDSGQEVARWNDFVIEKGSLAWSPAGDWIAVLGPAQPGNLTLVDTDSGKTKQPPNTQSITARCFAWNIDGSLFAIGDDQLARVCDTATGEVRQEFRHDVVVRHIAWSPDAKWLATVGGDQQIRLWNLSSGQLERTVAPLAAPFSACLAWTPDSTELTAALDTGEVYRINVAAGTVTALAFRLRGTGVPDTLKIATLAWSPTGECLLASGYSEAALWWPKSGELRRLDRLGDQTVWLPDGKRLFRGTWEAYLKTGHEAATGHRLGTLLPQIGDDQWLLVGPDGHYQGSDKIEDSLVYAVLTESGQQASYTPAEFAAKFSWKNDPAQARLLKIGP